LKATTGRGLRVSEEAENVGLGIFFYVTERLKMRASFKKRIILFFLREQQKG